MRLFLFVLFIVFMPTVFAQNTGSWGDQGNGTYINPVLNADYSDPDVIRVGNKYYMICSEFHFIGMTIQESDDMVNWKIIGRVYDQINFPEYDRMLRYKGGSWAPALRYHDGKFWVFFCTPQEGLFMTTALNPEGPWAPLLNVQHVARWEDPCPFWDDDGNAYLGHSLLGAGPIIVHKMSPDGTRLLDEGVTVYTGPVAEGTKIHKIGEYYYMSIPEGGVRTGWQTVLRSKNIYGPFEKKVVLETGSTNINGPHQGAMVDTPDGEWWFYHFQYAGAAGRVMHLQPMYWRDNWPVIGVDIDRNGIGEPVYVWKKPDVRTTFPIGAPQTDDEFDSPDLGLQWQWNHNPDDTKWSLTKVIGKLWLEASEAPNIKSAKNTLTQKIMGLTGEVSTKIDGSKMENGQHSGLVCMSDIFDAVGLTKMENKLFLFCKLNDTVVKIDVNKTIVYLKLQINISEQKNQFYYSADNKEFIPVGQPFAAKWGNWKGSRFGLFNYNIKNNGGAVTFDYLHYNYDGPKNQ